MSKTLIREDEGGLYANVGGWKVRPIDENSFYAYAFPEQTKLKAGDHVQASHSGGPLARVGGEHWMIERQSDWALAINAKYAALKETHEADTES